VLTPGIDLEKYAALPFASTLCGSCTAVCPVKIDLDAQLYRWRQVVTEQGYAGTTKSIVAHVGAKTLASPRLLRVTGALMRTAMRVLPAAVMRALSGAWGKTRELPSPPGESFSAWYRANRGAESTQRGSSDVA
jgi:L-lactate dehydrogenase complex protein LldF